MRTLENRVEVDQRTEQWIDVSIVAHVVAAIGLWRPAERRKPREGWPCSPGVERHTKVTDAVTVTIGE